MRTKNSWILLTIVLFSCKKEKSTVSEPLLAGAAMPVALLKDVVIKNLPSPYYHFEYKADSTISLVSFADNFKRYEVQYSAGRISELRNNIAGLEEKVQYNYDNAGKIISVNYLDLLGAVYAKVSFSYEGKMLIKLERQRKSGSDFVINKTMSFLYYADGNLKEIIDHRPAVVGVQDESTVTDRFEQYDKGINVDGFTLIHNEFFDHLVLLPGIHFQKNNPVKEILTSNELSYETTYAYSYNEKNLPVTKSGDLFFTAGPNTGQRFQTSSIFSYY